MRPTILSVLAILSLSSFSHTAGAESGFYLFGAVGNANSDADLGVRYGGLEFRLDSDASGFKVGGGYQFSRSISLEAAYQDFGTLTGPVGYCPPGSTCLDIAMWPKVDAAALSASFVGSFRIHNRVDGYGRFGLTRWEFKGSNIPDFDDSGEDLHYGGGLSWSVHERWRVFGEYTRVSAGLDNFGVGIRYGF